MHDSVLRWVRQAVRPSDIASKAVLEVGSFDVNGSVRPIIEAYGPSSYIGVDMAPGPGVDKVLSVEELVVEFGRDAWDVVISTEMLEHVVDWQTSIARMVDVLRPSGLLVLTTRSPGFPYHPYPIDTWRYSTDVMSSILGLAGLESIKIDRDEDSSPGVLVTATKPVGWVAPWDTATLGEVFAAVQPAAAPAS